MALTKEECEEASIDIEQALCDLEELRTHVSVNCIYSKGLETLNQLINEHFDNPPLKFEELEEGMWVWDTKFVNEYNLYEPTMIYITKVEFCRWGCSIIKYPTLRYKTIFKPLFGVFHASKFADNRFYRREVKELMSDEKVN